MGSNVDLVDRITILALDDFECCYAPLFCDSHLIAMYNGLESNPEKFCSRAISRCGRRMAAHKDTVTSVTLTVFPIFYDNDGLLASEAFEYWTKIDDKARRLRYDNGCVDLFDTWWDYADWDHVQERLTNMIISILKRRLKENEHDTRLIREFFKALGL